MSGTGNAPVASTATSFLSGGVRCAATVVAPQARHDGATPVIVMGHGFGSPRALRLFAYAERFAAAGYVVVVFDYRGFGDSDGEPRQVVDVSMQHADWRAALAHARTLSGVDPGRVIAWGSSFAGGHVLSIAGSGEPLAAVIAQVPHVSGPSAVKATGVAASMRLLPHAVRDQFRALLRRRPVYVPLIAEPGELGVMTTPDARPGLDRMLRDSGAGSELHRQDVAARIVLKVGLYSPRRRARRITCPTLVQIASRDAITPRAVAEKTARSISRSTVRVYDCGHFDPYVEPTFSQIIADELEFLRQHVPAAPAR